jgi:hypothetical protein
MQSGNSKTNSQLAEKSASGFEKEQDNSNKPGSSAKQSPVQSEASNGDLDQEQLRLSQSAAALAEKLRELSGKDPRVGVRLADTMTQVSQAMSARASHVSGAVPASTVLYSHGGLSGLAEVIQTLEQLLAQDLNTTDVAAEEYPKEYESLIAEYLRSLSYAQ